MASNKKISILGDLAVGKTSLVRRYVLNQFSPDYQATLGVNVYKYVESELDPKGGASGINFIIWDIEGNHHNADLQRTYLQGSAGALVVGDVTRDGTLSDMEAHAKAFLDVCPGRPLAFAANKIDLLEEGTPAPSQARLVEEFGAPAFSTSAKTGEAVPEIFRALGQRILQLGT